MKQYRVIRKVSAYKDYYLKDKELIFKNKYYYIIQKRILFFWITIKEYRYYEVMDKKFYSISEIEDYLKYLKLLDKEDNKIVMEI